MDDVDHYLQGTIDSMCVCVCVTAFALLADTSMHWCPFSTV